MMLPRHAGEAYVPPEISKKSTPASSSHFITTHCSAKLWPPSMTTYIFPLGFSSKYGMEILTILAVQLRCYHKLVRWKFSLDRIDDLQNKACPIFKASAIL